ncbi:MAG: MerR family regulatory protein [Cyanobacteria bacterium RYN_339]|nr:MerR family regulatory protein [Cyanobacteria bacterium RYN_339]
MLGRMTTELTSKEVADRIGVSMSTLKNWAVRLPVPSVLGPDGTRRFPEEALAVLEAVKQLRDDERSYATIRRTILLPELEDETPSALAGTSPEMGEEACEAASPETPSPLAGEVFLAGGPERAPGTAPGTGEMAGGGGNLPTYDVTVTLAPPEPPPAPDSVSGEAAVAMVTQVLQVLREEMAMAEAYASARQRVGELEGQVKQLQDDRLRLQAELADARRHAPQVEVQWARRPWYQRLKGYLFP